MLQGSGKWTNYHFTILIYCCLYFQGSSAFNRVERRIAPLSNQLAGVVLAHDAYGSHLDSGGKTIDVELERQNFVKAGETLAEVSQLEIALFSTQ